MCVISIAFTALGANEFLFNVAPSVARQVFSVFEFFATNATANWFFISVQNYVRFEIVWVFKTLATNVAEKAVGDVGFTMSC